MNNMIEQGGLGVDTVTQQQMDDWFDTRFSQQIKKYEESKTPSMSIIATKGTLDWAYPPFILASTAAAMGWEVSIFFTFYGLLLLKKDLDLKVSPLGNPAMPMKMPFGGENMRKINWPIPNAVSSIMPGFENMATGLMKKTFSDKGVASIEELRELSQEAEVRFIACQMTVDTFGFSPDDFIEGLDYAGAATFLPASQNSDITLFI